ncbi:Csu type fimbrial protein [Pseudomonas sp. TUM22785]|uniref:Csu type fimbrial protein n=1 Tax=Pseudomonas sp. TUM22785 TaxID=3019098 RepID=UPI0023060DFB|nr:spore coat U domain-containing protein [Pseudomonas sp. TUM22785]WCD81422.1 spore coat U domain-containing protein [Pseudomonas sp. TUM22785]
MVRRPLVASLALLPGLGCFADTGLNELQITQLFEIKAAVTAGCILGSGSSDVTTYGSINFGQVSTLPSDVTRVSTVGNGSIQLQCTPGTSLSIALNAGLNTASVTGGRYMIKGAETLRYQLYKDAGYSAVWGDGSNGATAMSLTYSATSGTQSYPVYARLFAVATMPSAGIYTDTVTVTVTY